MMERVMSEENEKFVFEVEEIRRAIERSFKLNEKMEEVIKLLDRARRDFLHLEKLASLAAKAIKNKDKFGNIKTHLEKIEQMMRNAPSSKYLEYLDVIDYEGRGGLLTKYLYKNYICAGMAKFIAKLINSYKEREECL
jgi:hypothetical protein